MADYGVLVDDLAAEEQALDAVVADLDDAGWATPSPAAGWDVRDCIAHLATAEELATAALVDPDDFAARVAAMLADLDGTARELEARGRSHPGAAVLEWWRETRAATVAALRERDPRDRVPWVTGEMSAMSFATARLMETWAHGHDVRVALGVPASVTPRLRHIADLGVRTRAHAYATRGLAVPSVDVRVELAGPDGRTWTWGEPDGNVVRGSALDFCLVVTQRAHVDDTALTVDGEAAEEWMRIAQAFAGPPTEAPRNRLP